MLVRLYRNGVERQLLNVKNDSSVLELKCAVFRAEKVPISEQTLTFDGLILEDGKSLSDYGLFDNCRVILFLRLGFQPTLSVIISFPSNRRLILDVASDENVAELKKRIEERTNLPLTSAELIYNHWVLEDSRRLVEYDIGADSVIMLVHELQAGPSLKLRDPKHTGAHITSLAPKVKDPDYQSLYYLANEREESQSRDSSHITVVFLTKDRSPVALKVRSTTAIGEVRGKLAQILQIPANKLWFVRKGESLDLSRSFSQYGFANGESVFLSSSDAPNGGSADDKQPRKWHSTDEETAEPKMRIIVQSKRGQTFACHVRPQTKIGVLKKHLQQEMGTSSASKITLFYQQQRLDDSRTIGDCDISNGSLLHVRS